jgi:UDP-GlcNAc:undecaprenyl-phosphate GlcNAc-1-phosphate transferase
MESVLELLKEYESYGLIALVVTVFATPIAAQVAKRLGVMDHPDQELKPHARPIPYLGGAAICLGWCSALIVAMLHAPETIDWLTLLPILIGGLGISALGLADDLYELKPKLRLVLSAALAGSVMLSTGIGFKLVSSLAGAAHLPLPAAVAIPLSFVAGLFIVLGACNSANLIDGLDGLCAGVTAIISLGFFVLASHIAIVEYNRDINGVRLALAVAMFGATLGFLPMNFNPAKIFMGDAGSMLLGYNCGIMLLLFNEHGGLRWMVGGLVVFALPIADTALAVFRRWRAGRSIFEGDRSHFYDQLVDRGMSVRQVVLLSYSLAAFFGALGCLTIWRAFRLRYMVIIYAVVIVLILATIAAAGLARAETRRSGHRPEGQPSD